MYVILHVIQFNIMKKIVKGYMLLILPFFIVSSCIEVNQNNEVIEDNPNIILLIGDGMGLSQLSAAFYYGNTEPYFARFKEIGFINTSSAKHKITDSGAGATAFACGVKTYSGAVGLNTDSLEIPNLVEVLSGIGYNTGVISTSSVTHATPACFYAHVKSRAMQDEIASQLVDSEIDFFAGGGSNYFINRKDSTNLYPKLEKKGFLINTDIESVKPDADYKYGFLLAKDGMPTMLANRGDFLPNYTQFALEYFTQSEESFFLMVEGSQIDWAGHDNNAEYLIAELLDFDRTVGVALDYAKLKGNTLVIVLADHETGGFTLAPNDGDYSTIKPAFATTGHSTTLIPVLAYGTGANNFKGIYQNNDIYNKILDLTKK